MRPTRVWTLYCHTHTESGRKYIGLTCKTMMHRWHQHVAQSIRLKGTTSHFVNAIRKYGKDAFSHEILAQSWTLEGANETEEGLIIQYGTRDLLKGFNIMRGGLHIPHLIHKNPWNDPEYRRKVTAAAKITFSRPDVRAAHDAKMKTPESIAKRSMISKEVQSRPGVRAKNSNSHKGKIFSSEHRAKLALNARNMSVEHRAKISTSLIGRIVSLETRTKLSRKALGRRHSDESRVKMSIACKGRVLSEEHKEKLRQVNTGRVLSPEVKEKISRSNKLLDLTSYLRTPQAISNHRAICSKLHEWDLRFIRLLLKTGYAKQHIADAFGVSRSLIFYHEQKLS